MAERTTNMQKVLHVLVKKFTWKQISERVRWAKILLEPLDWQQNKKNKIPVETGSFCLKLGVHVAILYKSNSLYRNQTILYKSVAVQHSL